MKKKFLKPNDPRLKKVSTEIPPNKLNSSDTKKLIEIMLKVAYGEQKDQKKPILVGLAAPQIGIFKRIILVDVKASGKGPLRPRSKLREASKVGNLRIYINPEITWASKRKGEWYEGCFSTGRVCGIVSRPVSIKVKAFTLKYTLSSLRKQGSINNAINWIPVCAGMTFVEEKHQGYIARIFQHEIDHLNGKVFISHIKDPDKLHWVEENEFPIYRDKQAWKNWPKKFPLPLAIYRLKKV